LILHGDPTWLSIDLRVFKVRANVSRFGVTMDASASQAATLVQQATQEPNCDIRHPANV
jgi:hypothetical protein